MPQLEQIQQQFYEALLMPIRGASRRVTELTPSTEPHHPTFFEIANTLIKPGQELSAAERLELYHRQYWYRILDSLAEDFPILRRMAGDALFWDLVETYLLEKPSQSFTLRHLGSGFADFLAKTSLVSADQQPWFYSIALLEYAYMESFEGLQSTIPDSSNLLDELISLQQHVRLFRAPRPAHLCGDWTDFTPASTAPSHPVWIAVSRKKSGQSVHECVSDEEAQLLVMLVNGVYLSDFFESLPEPQPKAEDITRWFARWQGNGWLGVTGTQGVNSLEENTDWSGLDRMGSQAFPMG